MFYTQDADGIMGIGVKPASAGFNPPNIIDTEIKEKRIMNDIVSLCLSHDGGFMSLDGNNHKKHLVKDSNKVIKRKKDENWSGQYRVPLKSMELNGKKLNVNYKYTSPFFDSGTTLMYFPSNIYREFKKEFNTFCQKDK